MDMQILCRGGLRSDAGCLGKEVTNEVAGSRDQEGRNPRENGRAVNRFGESARLGGSAGGGGVGWRGPGQVPVVGCLQDPGAEVAGIRASSGRVILRGARRAFTQLRAFNAVLAALAERRFPALCLLLPSY